MRSVLPILGLTLAALATSAQAASQKSWLHGMQQAAPARLCKIFLSNSKTKDLMAQNNINAQSCNQKMQKAFIGCANSYKAQMPQTFDKKSGSTWGEQLGKCAAGAFYSQYLATPMPKKKLATELVKIKPSTLCSNAAGQSATRAAHLTTKQCMDTIKKNEQTCLQQVLDSKAKQLRPGVAVNHYTSCLVSKLEPAK